MADDHIVQMLNEASSWDFAGDVGSTEHWLNGYMSCLKLQGGSYRELTLGAHSLVAQGDPRINVSDDVMAAVGRMAQDES